MANTTMIVSPTAADTGVITRVVPEVSLAAVPMLDGTMGARSVTVLLHGLVQPFAPVTVKFTVKEEPVFGAVTVMVWVPAPAVIDEPAETDQLYPLIPAGPVYIFPVELALTASGPVIEQVGSGLIVT